MNGMAVPRDPHLFMRDLVLLQRKMVGSQLQNCKIAKLQNCKILKTTFLPLGLTKVQQTIQHNKQCTYMHNMEECSCNHLCCVKAVSVRYSECVHSLRHPARKAYVPFYIAICGMSGPTIFFHIIISQTAQFKKKNRISY
jgi:hypothetical protein